LRLLRGNFPLLGFWVDDQKLGKKSHEAMGHIEKESIKTLSTGGQLVHLFASQQMVL